MTEASQKMLKTLIEAKGVSNPKEIARKRVLWLRQAARKMLMAVNWMTVFLGLVLLSFGVYLQQTLGADQWYVVAAIVVGSIVTVVSVGGAAAAQRNSKVCLRIYFVCMYAVLSTTLVISTLMFLFKDEAREYAKHNVVDSLSVLPKDFCGKIPFTYMGMVARHECALKCGDKVYELMVVMGLIGFVLDIALLLGFFAAMVYLTIRFLLRPMLGTTCVLMSMLCAGVIGYAANLASVWHEFMGEDIGGATLGTALGILIGLGVIVLGIAIFGIYANIQYAPSHIFTFVILQGILVVLCVVVSAIVYNQVGMLGEHILENFDSGTRIRKDLAPCFCNIDQAATCHSIECNDVDLSGMPVYYVCQAKDGGQPECLTPRNNFCMPTITCTERLAHNWKANLAAVAFLGMYTLLFLLCNAATGLGLLRRIQREETGELSEMEEMLDGEDFGNNASSTPEVMSVVDPYHQEDSPAAKKAPLYQPKVAQAVDISMDMSMNELEELMAQLETLKAMKQLKQQHETEISEAEQSEAELSPVHTEDPNVRDVTVSDRDLC